MLVQIIFYAFMVILTLLVLYLFIENTELCVCYMRRKIPLVPSTRALRRAVVKEINTNFSDMHTVWDIGSGYGGMARMIAKKCDKETTGLENMPFAVFVSKIADRITFSRNKTVWCDAFEYISKSDGTDIAIAYMGPGFNEQLCKYRDKFKVLITLVVPAEGLAPTRIIALPHGYTRYSMQKYPHKLFVYDLRKAHNKQE